MRRLLGVFHDFNCTTATNLGSYVEAIVDGADQAGFRREAVQFCTTTERLLTTLHWCFSRESASWTVLMR